MNRNLFSNSLNEFGPSTSVRQWKKEPRTPMNNSKRRTSGERERARITKHRKQAFRTQFFTPTTSDDIRNIQNSNKSFSNKKNQSTARTFIINISVEIPTEYPFKSRKTRRMNNKIFSKTTTERKKSPKKNKNKQRKWRRRIDVFKYNY